jgi:hypothetical protein
VCPRVIEVVMRIVGAGIVSDPSVVLGVDVGNVGVAFFIDGNEVRSPGGGGRSLHRRARLRGSRTASRDVSAANGRGGLLILRSSSQANQNGKTYNLFHIWGLPDM